MNKYNIGDEVVVYKKGRVVSIDEDSIIEEDSYQWKKVMWKKVIKYRIQYDDQAGSATVTDSIMEKADISA